MGVDHGLRGGDGGAVVDLEAAALLIALPVGAAIFYLGAPAQLGKVNWGRSLRGRDWVFVALGCAFLLLFFWLFAARLTNSASVVQRFASWQAVWRLWRDYPWLGVGPGGFFWRYPAYTLGNAALDPNLRHPHNLWLEFATSWGLVGLGWLLILCGVLGRQLRQFYVKVGLEATRADWATAWLTIGIGAGLAAGLLHSQVDAFMALADLAVWNWLALAFLATNFFPSTQTLLAERSQSSM
ncbi:MAG: O-antigen ligase family protein [Caldilineaceae bacterium]